MADVRKNSEVARLMQQITEEYEAAQHALYDTSMTAKHAFIIARMENMGRLQEELQEAVGAHQVMALVAEALERAEDL